MKSIMHVLALTNYVRGSLPRGYAFGICKADKVWETWLWRKGPCRNLFLFLLDLTVN